MMKVRIITIVLFLFLFYAHVYDVSLVGSGSSLFVSANRIKGRDDTTDPTTADRQYGATTNDAMFVNAGSGHISSSRNLAREHQKPPNILIILADDVGTGDVPMYWNNSSGIVHMPNLQHLADKGVTFLDAHASPLCAPSRYMLLSGNYPHRGQQTFGTWNINREYNQFRDHQQSIAEVLRDRGNYSTAMFGKWHIGGKVPLHADGKLNMGRIISDEDHDWSQPLIEGPQDIGFTHSMITPNGIQKAPYSFLRNGYMMTNQSDAKLWMKGTYTQPMGASIIQRTGEGDPSWDSTAYNMILVNETEKFIDNHMIKNPHNPFFVYVALGAVHGPHSPPDYYIDGTPVAGSYASRHMDMLLEMDKAVGSLMKLVEDRQLSNNTIVIFASDNGGVKPGPRDSAEYGHNSHGPLRGYKGTLYEGGHRIPFIFRWDGHFPANETRSNMVSISDIYTTLCDIVGVEKPLRSAQDSISFADYLYADNSTSSLRKWYGAWRGQHESIRKGNLKVIRHHDTSTGKKTVEVYNLKNDLSETQNLRRFMNRRLLKKLKKKMRKVGPCPTRDRKKSFMLQATKQIVSCDFFKENPGQCDLHNEGEILCPTVCARFHSFCNKFRWQKI